MKKTLTSTLAVALILLLGCKSGSPAGEGTSTTKSESEAVCVWDNISLKETPAESGKWLSAISIGEKVTYLDEKTEDTSGKKPVTYINIELKDGKKGWAQADFIILASVPGVISKDAELYSRPDLLNKTDKKFSAMDIIAVKSEQGDFTEVCGKRKDGKWIETGWVKTSVISLQDVDIAVAKFANKALAITDAEQRAKAIKEITDNSDFSSSVFMSILTGTEEKVETVERISDTVATAE